MSLPNHILLSRAHKHPTVCGWRGMERDGLLTWLQWPFCSCAIICGGALRAALQHHAALYKSVKQMKRNKTRRFVAKKKNQIKTHTSLFGEDKAKEGGGRLFPPQASNHESLPPTTTVDPEDDFWSVWSQMTRLLFGRRLNYTRAATGCSRKC